MSSAILKHSMIEPGIPAWAEGSNNSYNDGHRFGLVGVYRRSESFLGQASAECEKERERERKRARKRERERE